MKEDTTLVKQTYQYERGYYPSKTNINMKEDTTLVKQTYQYERGYYP